MASAASNIANTAKDAAIEDLRKAKILAQDAAKSKAYLYPFKGLAYFLMNRPLWKPLAGQLMPTITTATAVTISMFLFTYVPQAAVLTLVNGPLAFISTIALVLSESSTITNLIARGMFIDEALLDTFDGTLVSKDMTPLVSEGRSIKSGASDAISRLGKLAKSPFQRFTLTSIVRYFMYLPLNMIPVVGTVLFIFLQARKFGPQAHARYFQLKGMSSHQRDQWVERKRAAYTSFAVPALLLEMVPFVGIFFAFTNTTGAALWAADLEREQSVEEEGKKQS